MDLDHEAIGKRIKKARNDARLSQAELAEITDSSPQYISHIETARKKASLKIIVRIADALNVSVDQLLFGKAVIDRDDISGCSEYERQVILDTAAVLKQSLEENRKLLRKK